MNSNTTTDGIALAPALRSDPSSFLAGSSDLAELIRTFDWSHTSLGPIGHWPDSLKTMVNFMLQSPIPMVMLWGSDGVLIYNDGYAEFCGSRHPAVLGAKALEAWPEVAAFNQHVLDVGLKGGVLSFNDQHLVLYRNGMPEDVWLNLTYSPVVGEHGKPAGIMALVIETTARVQEERQRKQAEEYLQLALDTGAVLGSWVWNSTDKSFVPDERMVRNFAFDRSAATHGVPQSEWVARVHPDDLARVHAVLSETIATGGTSRVEYRARHANGAYQWVESSARCQIAADGESRQLIGVLIDTHERKQFEAALQQSEGRLRAIFDTLPVGIVFAEAQTGTITAGNAYVEQFVGQSVQTAPSIAGYKNALIYDVDGRRLPAEEYPLTIALTTGNITQRDLQYQRADGSRIWIRCIGAPIRDSAGQITSGLVTMIDIDDEKRAESRQAFLLALGDCIRELSDARDVMRATAEMLGRYMDAGRVGYGEFDPSATTLKVEHEWTNGRVKSFTGQHQLAGLRLAELDSFKAGNVLRLDDVTVDPRTVQIAPAFANFEVRAAIVVPLLKEERLAACIYIQKPVAYHWTDEEEQLLCDVAERTWNAVERARAEARLYELNATLETQVEERTKERDRIWNVSQDLLGIADQTGVWISINPAWRRTLGWAKSEIIGRTSEWMEHPDDRQKTRAEITTLAGGNKTLQFDNRFRHKDGSYRSFAWTAVSSDGLLYCVARDVTSERARQAELEHTQEQLRQSQKMEAVGQLTGGIAHDFNNLLTGITASITLMQRRMAAGRLEDVDRYATTALTSAKRAAALTHRLLAFSRRQSLDMQPTSVNALVESLADLLRRTIGEQITFTTLLQADLWQARTDSHQLENALLNLCINARDAMPRGGRLQVETTNRQLDSTSTRGVKDLAPGDYVVLRVSDTGSGMSPQVIAQAFDPFFTTKPIGQGTGLGLSMIYGFVKQSGGHIDIASQLGHGTTVELLLPRHTDSASAPQPEAPEALDVGSGEWVLVVEDDAAVRMVVLEVLDELGYRALEASDAPTALPYLTGDQPIDLLITDVGLPGMNGRQLADVALQHRPGLPVLFVTGYAPGAADRNDFLAPGMEMISKPFDIDVLASKIRDMIEQ